MADVRECCPACGSLEVKIETVVLVADGASRPAMCELCGWHGTAAETVAVATTGQMWDWESLAIDLLKIAAKNMGELMGYYEFRGLLPKMKVIDRTVTGVRRRQYEKHNAQVETIRNLVLRQSLELFVRGSFDFIKEMPVQFPEAYKFEDPEGDAAAS